MSTNVTKFNWDATESAPEGYPMEIIRGTFHYKGEQRGLYIPSGGTLADGWANPVSGHLTGEKYKPLPDRLTITFFSYPEKQFYKGEFQLPYDKILKLVRDGVEKNIDNTKFSRIMVGIAPGGAVAVWVIIHAQLYVEVFFGQAEKVDLDPGAAFALPFKDKEQEDEYIREGLVEVLEPHQLERLEKYGIPFGLWDRYRKKYEWDVVLSEGYSLAYYDFDFLNGERSDITGMKKRPVPKEIAFKTIINDSKRLFIVRFEENEIMDAFEKLGSQGEKIYMEFKPILPRENTQVRLYNDKESIILKKYSSKK